MFRHVWTATAVVLAALLASPAFASHRHQDVTVEIVDRNGNSFQQFPVSANRAYLRAENGERYRIRVRNHTGERIGLVIAVDGRNIISGQRSDLARTEPMYILSPWEADDYSGWRTSLAEVHEFYFTEWEDSYAEAFGDRSARGVIAVAVYRENVPRQELRERESKSARAPAPATADAAAEPGTGFGDARDEAAVRVAFNAAARASSKLFLKYEWPKSLCRRGLMTCDDDRNRFWNDDELAFAPPPPRR
jgi:FtsP/CotA-like multicopper oxidase with cupredoxin domain